MFVREAICTVLWSWQRREGHTGSLQIMSFCHTETWIICYVIGVTMSSRVSDCLWYKRCLRLWVLNFDLGKNLRSIDTLILEYSGLNAICWTAPYKKWILVAPVKRCLCVSYVGSGRRVCSKTTLCRPRWSNQIPKALNAHLMVAIGSRPSELN